MQVYNDDSILILVCPCVCVCVCVTDVHVCTRTREKAMTSSNEYFLLQPATGSWNALKPTLL